MSWEAVINARGLLKAARLKIGPEAKPGVSASHHARQ
jgi:hypothetical protein